MADGFPWSAFSANTMRPMMADLLRAGGISPLPRLTKEESLNLLEKIEKHGLKAALDGISFSEDATATSATKRKHEEPDAADSSASLAGSPQKRGRSHRTLAGPSAGSISAPAATRTRSKADADLDRGLRTRHQVAQARGEKPPVRSWMAPAAARSQKKPTQKKNASASASAVPRTRRPKTKPETNSTGAGLMFDGVELVKRPRKEKSDGEVAVEGDGDGADDEDAVGEVVDDAPEAEETSSLENSNKENDLTLLEIATAQTEGDAEGEDLLDVEGIGSPAPQISVEPTDDEIEEARLNNVSIAIGSPAPEITIEPMADDVDAEVGENGHVHGNGHGGLLRPRIVTAREGSVELNPEYKIEVYSPTSAVHDSDDETWVNGKKEGLRTSGGGSGGGLDIGALD